MRAGALLESLVYRLCGIDPQAGLDGQDYALARRVGNITDSGQAGQTDPTSFDSPGGATEPRAGLRSRA